MNAALELVNSEWWRGRPGGVEDKLDDPAWLGSYVLKTGLGLENLPSPAELVELKALRASLRALVEHAPGASLASLDAAIAKGAVRRRIVDGAVELEPVRRDWSWAVSEIAASFLDLLAHGESDRIKVCANDECQWSFYDESKNRSRRWCGAATCGTADKVRRFRERQRRARTEAGAPPMIGFAQQPKH